MGIISSAFLRLKLQKEGMYMNRNPKEKPCRLYLWVSPQEKKKITEHCGIPIAEYLRKRALGYALKEVPTDTFFHFYNKLCELLNCELSTKTETAALKLFDGIYAEIIDTPKQSKKETMWQAQDFGPTSPY